MKIAGLLVVALAGSVASAKIFDTSTAALSASGAFGDRIPGNAVTGFEQPQFVPGVFEPQAGWAASGVNQPWATISTANPHTGAQHLRTEFHSAVAPGTSRVTQSPNQPLPANTPDTSAMWFYISAQGGADYDLVGQALTQGFLTWRVKMNFQGGIFVLDDAGEGPAFQPTGVNYVAGQWNQLCVEMDPIADVQRYYINGTLIYTGQVYAGTSVEQLVTVHDNFQNPGEFADFDDYSGIHVPTPGSVALLGLCGLVAARRRRA
jgi:hypothetical protein